MHQLPEPPAAPAAGQTHIDDQAQKLLAAVEDAMRTPTSFRDDTPVPRYGTAPPVQQPGLPAMSPRATDAARLMMYGGLATVPPGIVLTAVLLASEHADPTIVGIVFGAPIALVLAIARLATRAKGVLPAEQHQHFHGTVHQQTTHSSNTGLWARTDNRQ
ncbi:hypothetical protein [Streptomyces sp. NPDC020377]|uniref:hypothetical protein n=1 Tax=Streptomyces sp. NPDC020377 TaxID=3365070 RepID=UPI0037985FE0